MFQNRLDLGNKRLLNEPSSTSVDNLIRQKLTGMTVSSNTGTGVINSEINSQEAIPEVSKVPAD